MSKLPSTDPLSRLSALLQVERHGLRATTLEELTFRMVNDWHGLVPYRQAVLWRRMGDHAGRIEAVSGMPLFDEQGPYLLWLNSLIKALGTRLEKRLVMQRHEAPVQFQDAWSQWLPTHTLWIPLIAPDGVLVGGMFMMADTPFTPEAISLLEHMADLHAVAWSRLLMGRGRWRTGLEQWNRKVVWGAVALLLAVVMMIPAPQSLLGQAEVTASEPRMLRAPLEGVVERLLVEPNQPVRVGEVVMRLDPEPLRHRLQIAIRESELARTEYRQAAQKGVRGVEDKAKAVLLRAKWEQKQAQRLYLESELKRLVVRSPMDGVALIDDPSVWEGRPVSLGERLFPIADPARAEITIWIPAAEAVHLEQGLQTRLFLNTDPLHPRPGELIFAAYRAESGPDGTLAYRARAQFVDDVPPPRLGLRGTARIFYGEARLYQLLLRRPLSAIRQWLGL
ncbi:MAG: HlyD family efflux transporter periplasmic adaptor subunit [Magnetococcales bacterium]|nr:HlyD family efflux transporter periplasmic adaptor subunit [Magnetococcales bacterium]